MLRDKGGILICVVSIIIYVLMINSIIEYLRGGITIGLPGYGGTGGGNI
jgi:hypothetical protein